MCLRGSGWMPGLDRPARRKLHKVVADVSIGHSQLLLRALLRGGMQSTHRKLGPHLVVHLLAQHRRANLRGKAGGGGEGKGAAQ